MSDGPSQRPRVTLVCHRKKRGVASSKNMRRKMLIELNSKRLQIVDITGVINVQTIRQINESLTASI